MTSRSPSARLVTDTSMHASLFDVMPFNQTGGHPARPIGYLFSATRSRTQRSAAQIRFYRWDGGTIGIE